MQAGSPLRRAFSGPVEAARSGALAAWRWTWFGAEALAAALSPSTYTPPVRALAARQVCAAALQVLPGFVVVCAALCYLVIGIVDATARDFGLSGYALDLFLRLMVLELIPLFVALFVALRSGAALGTEVALMRVRGELDAAGESREALRAQLLPRGIGVTASVLALTAIGILVALVVSYFNLYGLSPWGHAAYSRAIGHVLGPAELFGLALKVAFFAIAVAVIPVAAGLGAPRDMRFVPEAAPHGLVRLFVTLALVEAAAVALAYA